MEADRRTTRSLSTKRMRKLHQECRECFNLGQKDSRAGAPPARRNSAPGRRRARGRARLGTL
jgi:hypothetical protein